MYADYATEISRTDSSVRREYNQLLALQSIRDGPIEKDGCDKTLRALLITLSKSGHTLEKLEGILGFRHAVFSITTEGRKLLDETAIAAEKKRLALAGAYIEDIETVFAEFGTRPGDYVIRRSIASDNTLKNLGYKIFMESADLGLAIARHFNSDPAAQVKARSRDFDAFQATFAHDNKLLVTNTAIYSAIMRGSDVPVQR